MYNTVTPKCMFTMHLQLGTPGEFVKIAKDATKWPFAAHLSFSDVCDNFTATILLWRVGFGVFFTWEVLNNCFFTNFIACGRKKSKKKYWKIKFSYSLEQLLIFSASLKCLRLYLFFWNYSGKSFPKLVWEVKARLSAISSTSCALLKCYLKQDLSQHLLSANGVTPCKHCLFA